LVAAAKFLFAPTKKLFVVPYFVAVTKLFFSVKVNIDGILKQVHVFAVGVVYPIEGIASLSISI